MKDYPLLGSYAPLSEKDGFLPGTLQFAIKENAKTFMFYTGAPQNTKRRPVSDFKLTEFHEQLANSEIDLNTVCIHAPYVINLANSVRPEIWQFGVDFLNKEIARAAEIGVKIINLHPGAAVGADEQTALDQLVTGLNQVMETKPSGIKIALETMAGKGTEVGVNFEQMAYIIKNVKNNQDLGICMDTCHVFDAGYDIKDHWNEVKAEFNQIVGLDKLFCMHINDSKFGLNSHKDRHDNIGYGKIGFDALCNIIYDEDIKDVPKYLETPYIGTLPPYEYEIKMIREKKFFKFREKLEQNPKV